MPSISSKTAILERFNEVITLDTLRRCISEEELIQLIRNYVNMEYAVIPDKDRVGKGSVYIAKIVGKPLSSLLSELKHLDVFAFADKLIDLGDQEKDRHLYNIGLAVFSYHMSSSILNLSKGFEILRLYADHPNWEVREMATYGIRESVKAYPKETLAILRGWIHDENDNVRRIASESLRPLSDMKWLRDQKQNDPVLDLLSVLKADPSEYVRKSVGNNLKDLTKYMPVKILNLLEQWFREEKVMVTFDLASKTKEDFTYNHPYLEHHYYLVWTAKHALRWLRERNPEFHERIEKILGLNYVLYFDEKKNKLAKPE